ncbi:unnamed protein product [Rangifer tarandus platyrhynchus]|uniref:Uncharacterized protein n=2 Tax=Rangifer tarandus platyrhynchus TaxID=3082113 RepID=A0ABN8Y273_RANTA|nr:unnamed protein product [Rangifer tarandus platyrhynchus]CAI9155731.1 unnamed protein product [Rangifer tarandus platyrhynchus]
MKTEAMVSSAHAHGLSSVVSLTGLPASPELLPAVTSLSARPAASPSELRHRCCPCSAAAGPSVGGDPRPLPRHPLGPGCTPGILSAPQRGCSQPSASPHWEATQNLGLRYQGDRESGRTLPWGL